MFRLVVGGALLGVLVLAVMLIAAASAAPGDTVADAVFGQGNIFAGRSCSGQQVYNDNLCGEARGVAVDAAGNLYVADTANNRMVEYNTPATSDTLADTIFGSCSTTGGTTLCSPSGVAVDSSGNVYVADSGRNRVLEYNTPLTTDTVADAVFGQNGSFTSSSCGIGPGELCHPVGVAVDSSGNVYVADKNNNRVLEYNTPLTTDTVADVVFGQLGDPYGHLCNHGTTNATLCFPTAVAVDAAGNVYINDAPNNRVMEYDSPLTTDTVADRKFGQPTDYTQCNYGGISASTLCSPEGVTVDAAGNLYVADNGNKRVLVYNAAASSDSVADKVFGQSDFVSNTCNGTSASTLCSPHAIAVDSANRVFVGDGVRVLEFDSPLGPTPTPTGTAAPADLSVTMSFLPNPPHVASPMTYTVTVHNGGPNNAASVTVTDTLPVTIAVGSMTPSQGSCGLVYGVITCALGSIANGADATVQIVITPPNGTGIVNSANVSGTESDPNNGNNAVFTVAQAWYLCTKSDSTVVYRNWITPAGDDDCDGFTNAIENFVGTMPLVACSTISSQDAWPPDFNTDGVVNLTDIFEFIPYLNMVGHTRLDLSGNGVINLQDIFLAVPFLNKPCAF